MSKPSKVLSRLNPGDPPLAVRMLGPMRVDLSGAPARIGSQKALALLAYLCLRRTPVARETLSALLWGDSADAQAKASLRQALMVLRKGLESSTDVLRIDAGTVGVDARSVALDVVSLEMQAESGDIDALEAAAATGSGDLLEGFGAVTPEFDRWLAAERGAMRSLQTATLLRLADAYTEAGRTEEAIAACQRLLVLDPLQEHVHRRLIRAFMLQRRHDAALRQFAELKRLLADELGVGPEPPTLDLIREVRRARSEPTDGRDGLRQTAEAAEAPLLAASAPRVRPSIAVLPFRPLTDGAEAAFFGEGMAEDVTTELAREADLLVVSRQSALRVGGEDKGAAEIGRKLGVRFLVGGSVRLLAGRVRVSAHLVHCEDGREIWAERYDREAQDAFEIQTDIARTVTATVVGRIADAEVRASQARPVRSLESFILVLRGIQLMHPLTSDALDAAIDLFEQATSLSLDYARAHGLLAIARMYRNWYYSLRMDVADILPIAERAVALDPREPKGHCALGIGNLMTRRWSQASFHLEAGLAANPNDDLLLVEYGRLLMYVDRPEDGLRRIRDAMRLNPYHPTWYWNLAGRCLVTLGRHEEALDAFLHIANPPYYITAYIAACHAALGDRAAAAAARDALYRTDPQFDIAAFAAAFPYKNPATLDRFVTGVRLGLAVAP